MRADRPNIVSELFLGFFTARKHCSEHDAHERFHGVQVHRCHVCDGLVKPGALLLVANCIIIVSCHTDCRPCGMCAVAHQYCVQYERLLCPFVTCWHPHCVQLNADIVFFGENLPERFFAHKASDLKQAELLIIMGTSLVVYPFASIPDSVPHDCPRLLINREVAGEIPEEMRALGYKNGLWFGEGNTRDAKFLGECDHGVTQLAQHLGWEAELAQLVGRFYSHASEAQQTAMRAAEAAGTAAEGTAPAEHPYGDGRVNEELGFDKLRVSLDPQNGAGGSKEEPPTAEQPQFWLLVIVSCSCRRGFITGHLNGTVSSFHPHFCMPSDVMYRDVDVCLRSLCRTLGPALLMSYVMCKCESLRDEKSF